MQRETAIGNKPEMRDAIEQVITEVVEDGSFVADSDLTLTPTLTARERLTGEVEMKIGPVFTAGLMLGAALEQDIPVDSDKEEAWRRGEFTFPDQNG